MPLISIRRRLVSAKSGRNEKAFKDELWGTRIDAQVEELVSAHSVVWS